jgi:hypothetical protein
MSGLSLEKVIMTQAQEVMTAQEAEALRGFS